MSSCSPIRKAHAYIENHYPAVDGGKECETEETENCPIDCDGDWGAWSTCTSTSKPANEADYEQARTYSVRVPPLNNGKECPGKETRPCTPVVCFSVAETSTAHKIHKGLPLSSQPPYCDGQHDENCLGRGHLDHHYKKSESNALAILSLEFSHGKEVPVKKGVNLLQLEWDEKAAKGKVRFRWNVGETLKYSLGHFLSLTSASLSLLLS